MKNKLKTKLKFFASLAAIPMVATPLILSVAADENKKPTPNNKDNQKPDKKKPKVPKNDPNFASFKEEAKKTVEDSLKKGIENALVYVKARQEEILENKEIDFKVKIQQLIYLRNLQGYLEKNKENIFKNPNDYGFYLNTPTILGTLKNYDIKDIEFNGQTYKQIKVGKTDPLSYKKAVEPNGKITDVQKDQINDIEEIKYKDTLKKYQTEFLKEINKLVYDEKDVLEIGKDVELKRDENGQFYTTLPKGYRSWDEYFVRKMKDRVTAFDLNQNQQTNDNQEQEDKQEDQKENIKPPSLPPPLVDGDQNEIDLPPTKANAIVSSLPLLLPFVSPEYTNNQLAALKSQFDGATPELKQKMFFFNNPINTRYLYSLESFDVNGNEMVNIKMKIVDQVNPKLHRTYTINKYQPSFDLGFNSLKLTEINAIKKIYLDLYKNLGLDEKIDYKNLRNSYIKNALFSMIEAAQKLILKFNKVDKENKLIGEKTYATQQSEFLEEYRQKFDGGANAEALLEQFDKLSQQNFLRYLNNTLINNDYYWYQLVDAYKKVTTQFSEVIRFNKDIIKKNVATINGDENTIANLFTINKQLINQLSAIVSQRSFDLQQWFKTYIEALKPIKQNFDLLSVLTNRIEVKTDANKTKEYKTAYDSALKALEAQDNIKKQIHQRIGIAFIVISLLVLITNLVVYGLLKKLKNKKAILIINSVVMVLTIIILIMGIILIV